VDCDDADDLGEGGDVKTVVCGSLADGGGGLGLGDRCEMAAVGIPMESRGGGGGGLKVSLTRVFWGCEDGGDGLIAPARRLLDDEWDGVHPFARQMGEGRPVRTKECSGQLLAVCRACGCAWLFNSCPRLVKALCQKNEGEAPKSLWSRYV
jgi:hypothetical protein